MATLPWLFPGKRLPRNGANPPASQENASTPLSPPVASRIMARFLGVKLPLYATRRAAAEPYARPPSDAAASSFIALTVAICACSLAVPRRSPREQFDPLGTVFLVVRHRSFRLWLVQLFCAVPCGQVPQLTDAADIEAGEILWQYLGEMEHVSVVRASCPRINGYRLTNVIEIDDQADDDVDDEDAVDGEQNENHEDEEDYQPDFCFDVDPDDSFFGDRDEDSSDTTSGRLLGFSNRLGGPDRYTFRDTVGAKRAHDESDKALLGDPARSASGMGGSIFEMMMLFREERDRKAEDRRDEEDKRRREENTAREARYMTEKADAEELRHQDKMEDRARRDKEDARARTQEMLLLIGALTMKS
ncbi:hypothetical protein GQ600_24923 [Phytophthora cactorum]|nr:hypothetical protein GQ600_24923 [Phytophthora cactorum]